MAIRVKCKCGTSVTVSSKQADTTLSCSGCGRPFRIPAAKFAAAAAKARAAKAPPEQTAAARPGVQAKSKPMHPPGPEPAELDLIPANLDGEIAATTFNANKPQPLPTAGTAADIRLIDFAGGQVLDDLAADAANAASTAAPAVVPVAQTVAPTMGYAADPVRQGRHVSGAISTDVIQGPQRGFWADAFSAFIYPVMSARNAVTFAITAVVTLSPVLFFLLAAVIPCVGLLAAMFCTFIAYGWICSVLLSVIQDTAAGSDEMPGGSIQGGFMEDAIKPFFRFLGAVLIVFLPAILLSLSFQAGFFPRSAVILVPVWIAVGFFLLPLSLLLFALDAQNLIVRLDLIFLTIIRTILPYLAIWLMLILAFTAYLMLSASSQVLAWVGLSSVGIGLEGMGFVGAIITNVLEVYLSLISMRIIGLYYLHFKRRFAFLLE